MENYSWIWVICLLVVVGILLFVFIYTLNRTPKKDNTPKTGVVIKNVNIDANTISFYSTEVGSISIFVTNPVTYREYTLLTDFNVAEANTIYNNVPSEIIIKDLPPGVYEVGYFNENSGNNNFYIYSFAVV